MRDGKRWDNPADSEDTGEMYDLVVVGGGISGLAAAYFFQKENGPDARILIVDNHDDFGGHAKRNEYHYKDRMFIDLGGTAYIENPQHYPPNARALIEDLGIDISRSRAVFDHDLYPSLNLRGGIFFEREAFGKDRLVAGKRGLLNSEFQSAYITLPAELENRVGDATDVRKFLERSPLSANAVEEIVELYSGDTDYWPGLSLQEKLGKLESMSYIDFLEDVVEATRETADFFRMWRASYMGNGVDVASAYSAMRYGLPGSKGLGLDEHFKTGGYQPHNYKEDFHFPDGNASVARMLFHARHRGCEVRLQQAGSAGLPGKDSPQFDSGSCRPHKRIDGRGNLRGGRAGKSDSRKKLCDGLLPLRRATHLPRTARGSEACTRDNNPHATRVRFGTARQLERFRETGHQVGLLPDQFLQRHSPDVPNALRRL
jgi:hypothetical protein